MANPLKLGCLLVLALAAGTPPRAAEPIANTVALNHLEADYERLLVNALESIRHGELDQALGNLRPIVEAYPQYRLAQLMYADLLMAKSRPIHDFGNFQSAPDEQVGALLDEARARWRHHVSPPPDGTLPAALIKLSEAQPYAVVVDLNASRLYLYRNVGGMPDRIADFYVTIGKNGTGKVEEGDQKTPVGVYFVTGFIQPEKLPDLYGIGAFPIDYPNIWDRRHGRTGYGIWLHGTPSNTLYRPPRDSDGCVILGNDDLASISTYLAGDTPVILTEGVEWLDRATWLARQAGYESMIEQWRRDWESLDPDLYLAHYAPDYSGLGMDYQDWVEYKTRVNASKDFIRVELSEKSIFRYPGESGLLVVTFVQRYRSDNLEKTFLKRQYWRMEPDGHWKIIYEGSVS